MNLRLFAACATMAASIAAPTSLLAQYSAVRLVPKEVGANELAGILPGSVAAGTTKLALGSPLAKNPKLAGTITGGVYLFDSKTGKQLPTLYPPATDANVGMQFGSAVAISGKYLVVGARQADDLPANTSDNRGAVYVFDLNTLKLIFRIQDPSFAAGDEWGTTVAVDRNQVVIGAPKADLYGVNAGNAATFDLVTGSLRSCVPASAVDPIASGDAYGSAVAIRNGIVAVGAPNATVSGDFFSGRVYLLDAAGTDQLFSQIDNPDPGQPVPLDGTGDSFGSSLAFGGQNDLLISKPYDDDGILTDAGGIVGVYIGDVTAPSVANTVYGGAKNDYFGTSVAAAENLALTGAPGMDSPDTSIADIGGVVMGAGASSIFLPGPLASGDALGSSVAYADGILVASSPYDDTAASNAGALWLFKAPKTGQLPLAAFILKGDSAVGSGQTFFSSFTGVSTPQNDFALPAYSAKLTGPGTTGGKSQGIWGFDSGNNPLLFARSDSSVGPGLVKPNTMTSMISNVAGTVWYFGNQTTAGSKRALFSNILNGPTTVWMAEGDVEPAGTVAKILDGRADNISVLAAPGEYAIPFSYKIGSGGPAVTAADDSAIRFFSSVAPVTLREGSGIAVGVNFGQFGAQMAYSKTIFSCIHGLAGTGVTPADNLAVTRNAAIAARKGSTAPGFGTPFLTFLGVTHSSDTGSILIRGTVKTGGAITAANNEALWSDRSGSLALVLAKGSPAPLLSGGVSIKKFISYYITSFNDVLALVQVGGPGVTPANDMVLYQSIFSVGEPGDFNILLREGDRIPGNDGAKVSAIQMVDFTTSTGVNKNSYYGVLAALANEKGGATPATNLVWMVGDNSLNTVAKTSPGLPQVKLRKGVSAGGTIGKQSIASFTLPVKPVEVSGAGNTGLAHAIGGVSGNSTVLVTYPDKSTGVLALTVPLETP